MASLYLEYSILTEEKGDYKKAIEYNAKSLKINQNTLGKRSLNAAKNYH